MAKWKKRTLHGGCAYRAEGGEVDGPDDRARGGDRRLSSAHAATAGRLPLRPAGQGPEPYAFNRCHRCLQRHGISRLPQIDGEKTAKSKFKTYPIGFFHIDTAEVRTEEGKLHLFVGIDRTCKFAFVELHEKATTRVARRLPAPSDRRPCPTGCHTILTDIRHPLHRP